MNAMRVILFCALVGWMAADAQAQLGTYGSPDPIPLGQYASGGSYVPAAVSRTSYVAAADGSGPTLNPAPYGGIPQPPSESSAVSAMLNQPGPVIGAPSVGNVPPSGGCMQEAGNCGSCGSVCGGGCCSRWYASFDALYLTRNEPNRVYTSAEPPANPVNQGYFNDFNWVWGGQGTVGYRFGCGCEWALEGTYWGTAESNSDGGPGIPGPYVSPMTFGLTSILGTTGGSVTAINPNGYQTANNYTDGSQVNHTWRNYQAQDAELNLVRTVWGCECDRFNIDVLAGFRWFRFQDGLVFGAERGSDGTPYANDWLYLNDHITNDLYGGQIGCTASYRFADCWKVFVIPKVGVYDNHMTLDYNLYAVNGAGQQFQGSSQTYTNPNYPVHATSDGFSFLTQVDLGLDWQVMQHVSTQLGYRVVAVTGMGLSDSQIPFYGNDTQAIADIHHSDSLILHGAFGGFTVTW